MSISDELFKVKYNAFMTFIDEMKQCLKEQADKDAVIVDDGFFKICGKNCICDDINRLSDKIKPVCVMLGEGGMLEVWKGCPFYAEAVIYRESNDGK